MRRRLNAVFAVVVTAFVALDAFVVAALWPQLRNSEALSTRYAANSLLIARMGGALHTIRASATQYHVQLRNDSPADEAPTAGDVAVARAEFQRTAAEYAKVPMGAREVEAWELLSRDAIPSFLRAVDDVVEAPAGPLTVDQPAMQRLRAATVRVAGILEELARINAEGLESAGAQIHEVVVTLVFVALAIGAVAVTGMLLLVRWALAAVGEYERSTAERLAELDQFAGRVAHDLRNPLQAIGMSLSLMYGRAEDERSRRTVARAQEAVRRMTSFIQELLEFARSGAKPDPGARASVGEAVRSVENDLATAAAEKQVQLSVDVPDRCFAALSPAALRAIVGNLAENAVKHMPDGAERARRVEIAAEERRGEVVIRVSDNGQGISREALPRLFEPFFRATSSAGGFGIGLKTVKRLVDAHGGRVAVESEEGEGTSFTIVLPAAMAPDGGEPDGAGDDAPRPRRGEGSGAGARDGGSGMALHRQASGCRDVRVDRGRRYDRREARRGCAERERGAGALCRAVPRGEPRSRAAARRRARGALRQSRRPRASEAARDPGGTRGARRARQRRGRGAPPGLAGQDRGELRGRHLLPQRRSGRRR